MLHLCNVQLIITGWNKMWRLKKTAVSHSSFLLWWWKSKQLLYERAVKYHPTSQLLIFIHVAEHMSTTFFCFFLLLYTHPFNGPLSRTTRYQKVKTNLDFTEARDSKWQWRQLGHICTSLQIDNHASTPPPHLLLYCFG